MPNKIKFYKTGEAFDVFSNVTPIPVRMNINGQAYDAASSEAVYQGCKGLVSQNTNDVALSHRLLTDPYATGGSVQKNAKNFDSRSYSHFHQQYARPDAFLEHYVGRGQVTVKEQLMYETCLAKATQNPEMLKALLETGDDHILENTSLAPYNDDFWGNGHGGNGRNALGNVWMAVRANLKQELQKTGAIQVRSGFSDNLALTMGHQNHVPGSQLSGAYITGAQLSQVKSQNVASQLSPNRFVLQQPVHTSVSQQHAYAPQGHSWASSPAMEQSLVSFALQFCKTHPRQTKMQAGNITYGVSGSSGGFYIEGQDRHRRPIKIYIDPKARQITENGKVVGSSTYAKWAIGEIQKFELSKGNDKVNAAQQSHVRSFALQFCKTHTRQTRMQVGNIIYGVSGSSGGFYIEGQDRHRRPIKIYIDPKTGQITENGKAVKESKYADWAIGEIKSPQMSQGRQGAYSPSAHLFNNPQRGQMYQSFSSPPSPRSNPAVQRRGLNQGRGGGMY